VEMQSSYPNFDLLFLEHLLECAIQDLDPNNPKYRMKKLHDQALEILSKLLGFLRKLKVSSFSIKFYPSA
jgi:hypothetical protein